MSRPKHAGGAGGAPASGHFEFFNWVPDSGLLADLKPLEVKVLWVYLRYANNETGEAWPSVQRVAEMIGKSPDRTRTRNAIHALRDRGILKLHSQGGRASRTSVGRSSVYRLARGAELASIKPVSDGRDSGGMMEAVCPADGGDSRGAMEADFAPGTANRTTQVTPNKTPSASGGVEGDDVATEKGRGDANRSTPRPSADAQDVSGFDRCWEIWPDGPRKFGRPQARTYWFANDLEPQARTIYRAIRALRSSEAWRRDGGRWVPGFLNWLKGEGWDATPEPEPDPDTNDLGKMVSVPEHVIDQIIPPATPEEVDRRWQALENATPSFDRFYSAYPEHLRCDDGRGIDAQHCECRELWRKLGAEKHAHRIMECLEAEDWTIERNDPYYWLKNNRCRWEARP